MTQMFDKYARHGKGIQTTKDKGTQMTPSRNPTMYDLATPDELAYLGKHISQELLNNPVSGVKSTADHTLVQMSSLRGLGFTTIVVKLSHRASPVIYNLLDPLPEDAADEIADFLFEVKDGLWNVKETE